MFGGILLNADPAVDNPVAPIFVSVKDAARMLGISPWSCYQLLNEDPPPIESRYKGRRRLVLVTSLHEYAKTLPTERPVDATEAEA